MPTGTFLSTYIFKIQVKPINAKKAQRAQQMPMNSLFAPLRVLHGTTTGNPAMNARPTYTRTNTANQAKGSGARATNAILPLSPSIHVLWISERFASQLDISES